MRRRTVDHTHSDMSSYPTVIISFARYLSTFGLGSRGRRKSGPEARREEGNGPPTGSGLWPVAVMIRGKSENALCHDEWQRDIATLKDTSDKWLHSPSCMGLLSIHFCNQYVLIPHPPHSSTLCTLSDKQTTRGRLVSHCV